MLLRPFRTRAHHRNARVQCPHRAQDLDAVHPGHEDVEEYGVGRRKSATVTNRLTTHKAATVNRETQILGQAFRLAVARERITAAPAIRRLAECNTRTGFFERADFEAVAAYLPDDVRDAVTFGYYSG